jgi:hypothetical protein
LRRHIDTVQAHTLDIPDRGTTYNVLLGFFVELR